MLAPQLGHKKGKTQACPDPHAEAESATGHTSVQTMKGGSLRAGGWTLQLGHRGWRPSQVPAFAVTPETAGVLGGAQQLSGEDRETLTVLGQETVFLESGHL